jgi:hypothetical protein
LILLSDKQRGVQHKERYMSPIPLSPTYSDAPTILTPTAVSPEQANSTSLPSANSTSTSSTKPAYTVNVDPSLISAASGIEALKAMNGASSSQPVSFAGLSSQAALLLQSVYGAANISDNPSNALIGLGGVQSMARDLAANPKLLVTSSNTKAATPPTNGGIDTTTNAAANNSANTSTTTS